MPQLMCNTGSSEKSYICVHESATTTITIKLIIRSRQGSTDRGNDVYASKDETKTTTLQPRSQSNV